MLYSDQQRVLVLVCLIVALVEVTVVIDRIVKAIILLTFTPKIRLLEPPR